jgi:hypothetical protein
MNIVVQLKQALIDLGATDVSGETIKEVLKSGLGSITGNVLVGDTIAKVLNNFVENHTATVVFSTTPTGATIVVKSGSNVIAPYDGKYYLQPGSYTYTASADGYVTQTDQALTILEADVDTTKTVTVTLEAVPEPVQLTTPTNLAFDGVTSTLTWDGDANATRYDIGKLVGEVYTIIGSTADGTESFPVGILSLEPGTYNLVVRAVGDEPGFANFTNSEWSTSVEAVIGE